MAVVTFEPAWLAAAYIQETACPWPVLLDESLQVYRAYGFGRLAWRDLWSPRTIAAYLRLLLTGRRLRRASGDIHQAGGDVLVDPAGIVRLHHVGRTPADRPAVDAILQAADAPR